MCSLACDSAIKCNNALDAVVEAVKILEDSPYTNAGYGSNLCTDGTVECDASCMTSSPFIWAGVGGLTDIKNPIIAARKLYDSQLTKRPLGLVSPILLTGKGARDFAINEKCQLGNLITESSKKSLEKYLKQVNDYKPPLDTVGAIAIGKDGTTASASSSGGVLLKTPGRLGQASSFGSGCWSYQGVTLTTSGVGEHLILSQLASRMGQKLGEFCVNSKKIVVDIVSKSFESDFINSPFLSHIKSDERAGGVLILVKSNESSRIEFSCVHNTPSMIFGYRSKSMKSTFCDLSHCELTSKLTIKGKSV